MTEAPSKRPSPDDYVLERTFDSRLSKNTQAGLTYEDERLALGESYDHIYRKRCMSCNGVFEDDEVHYIEKYEEYQCNKCWDRHKEILQKK